MGLSFLAFASNPNDGRVLLSLAMDGVEQTRGDDDRDITHKLHTSQETFAPARFMLPLPACSRTTEQSESRSRAIPYQSYIIRENN